MMFSRIEYSHKKECKVDKSQKKNSDQNHKDFFIDVNSIEQAVTKNQVKVYEVIIMILVAEFCLEIYSEASLP